MVNWKHLGSQSILDVKSVVMEYGTLVYMLYLGKLSHNAHASPPNDRFQHVIERKRDTCNQGKENRTRRGERIGEQDRENQDRILRRSLLSQS